jgi:hypothetical protein
VKQLHDVLVVQTEGYSVERLVALRALMWRHLQDCKKAVRDSLSLRRNKLPEEATSDALAPTGIFAKLKQLLPVPSELIA